MVGFPYCERCVQHPVVEQPLLRRYCCLAAAMLFRIVKGRSGASSGRREGEGALDSRIYASVLCSHGLAQLS